MRFEFSRLIRRLKAVEKYFPTVMPVYQKFTMSGLESFSNSER